MKRDRILLREWVWAPVLLGVSLIAAGLTAPEVKADGILSATEAAYVLAYGEVAVCATLDDYPSTAGVLGVADGIMDDGFTADNAIDIINASVMEYCPRHWPMLVQIGKEARRQAMRTA